MDVRRRWRCWGFVSWIGFVLGSCRGRSWARGLSVGPHSLFENLVDSWPLVCQRKICYLFNLINNSICFDCVIFLKILGNWDFFYLRQSFLFTQYTIPTLRILRIVSHLKYIWVEILINAKRWLNSFNDTLVVSSIISLVTFVKA